MKKPAQTRPVDVAEPTETTAQSTLRAALEQVSTKNRVHGDTDPLFRMIAELWSIYVFHANTVRPEITVSPHDVAQLMVLLKIARSVYGYSADNYVDEGGYAALASQFRTREPE